MCSSIQVFLLFSSCSAGDAILFFMCSFLCVCTDIYNHEEKMNQHYIPSLSKGLFLHRICWMYFALMELS